DSGHRTREEALPRALDERVADEAEGEEAERGGQHRPPAQPGGEHASDRPRDEADAGVRGEDELGDAEADPALVVQVDEQERDDQPVAERIHQPAQLEQLHGPRQVRVQAAEEAEHRETVAAWISCSTRGGRSSTTAATAPAPR